VIWKRESEFAPSFYIYYITYGKLIKIGEWVIYEPNGELLPDYFDYSIDNIRIHQKNNEIEFSFLKNMDFIDTSADNYNEDWVSYQAGELILSFNITNGTRKRVEK
jgi:hypothetical protein